jgi:monoamine oxidase
VTILEGRDRIGGRCYTSNSLGIPVDMGAQILTGLVGNPLYDLVQQTGIDLHELQAEQGMLLSIQFISFVSELSILFSCFSLSN